MDLLGLSYESVLTVSCTVDVFWNMHEPRPTPKTVASLSDASFASKPAVSEYNFTGRYDLFGFISAAAKHGLRVILRLGPYVCAEVSYGGFPARLRDVPEIKFRTWNKAFMDEVGHWIRHVSGELRRRKLMAPEGGPVILVQLENEYSMVSEAYGDEGARYLQWMADLQRELALGVPAIMCYGAADGVVETINSFAAHLDVDELKSRRPEQPLVWTECWTGWYDVWGAATHRRASSELAYNVARFFAVGGTGVNYYMWMGGTNWGREGMYLQKSSYDYDAPVDEFYRTTSKALHLTALHQVLLNYLDALVSVDAPREYKIGEKDNSIVVYDWAGKLLFYCNDTDDELPLNVDAIESGTTMVPKSVEIRAANSQELLFDSASSPTKSTLKSTPANVVSGSWQWTSKPEPVPTPDSIDKLADQSNGTRKVAKQSDGNPMEQVAVTRDASDYCFYTAEFEVGELADPGPVTLSFQAADYAHVYIDGQFAARTDTNPPWEDRFTNKWTKHDVDPGFIHSVQVNLERHEGQSITLTVLVASLGLVKGDWELPDRHGMEQERKGLLGDIESNGTLVRKGQWLALPMTHGECAEWPQQLEKYGEERAEEQDQIGSPRWSFTTVTVQKAKSWTLDLAKMGKGLLWVNGIEIARYWDVLGTRGRCGFLDGSEVTQTNFNQPCQSEYHVPGWVVDSEQADEELCTLRIVLFDEFGCAPPQGENLLKVVQE